MAIYRVFSDSDGESHIEDITLEDHPELGSLLNISEVKVQEFDGSRNMDFHPLGERRLIVHLSGEVEIGASDGSKRVLRAGDIRFMEDTSGKGHTHLDHVTRTQQPTFCLRIDGVLCPSCFHRRVTISELGALPQPVIPAQERHPRAGGAGIHVCRLWTPAFAGETIDGFHTSSKFAEKNEIKHRPRGYEDGTS